MFKGLIINKMYSIYESSEHALELEWNLNFFNIAA